jgi:hypothetical protein
MSTQAHRHSILVEGHPVPVDNVELWAQGFAAQAEERILKTTQVGHPAVFPVFLGFDPHVSSEEPPLLYAARVFDVPDGTTLAVCPDLSAARYRTPAEATHRHDEMVADLRTTAQLP